MSNHTLFEAWWYGCDHTHVATFFDRTSAETFCKKINDECRADVMEIEAVALIDNYGYPCSSSDYFKGAARGI